VIHETIVYIPPYSDVREFVGVNRQPQELDVVMYAPVLQAAEQIYGFEGEGIGWEEMRQFAIDHRSVWLTHYHEGQVSLRRVGAIAPDMVPATDEPLARFEGGPVIESATVEQAGDREWAITINWLASGPVDARIFIHVLDSGGHLATQADGPALGGMVPIWLWRAGDRIQDVRHISVPRDAEGPYTVLVGVYTSDGRFPAFRGDTRYPDDAATIATLTD
jgi:hypothetical protein